jgi:hypothetical protein
LCGRRRLGSADGDSKKGWRRTRRRRMRRMSEDESEEKKKKKKGRREIDSIQGIRKE